MITKYSDAYNVLFEEATKRLEDLGITKTDDKGNPTGEAIVIGSLEEYFSHLKDLVYGDGSLTEKEQQAGYLFLKLPLDEPAFKIDANSRAIEIPGHYLANGLSVQGDEVAEIVFFEIDRFFDATDLSMQSISIQWETPKGVQGWPWPCALHAACCSWCAADPAGSQSGKGECALRTHQA